MNVPQLEQECRWLSRSLEPCPRKLSGTHVTPLCLLQCCPSPLTFSAALSPWVSQCSWALNLFNTLICYYLSTPQRLSFVPSSNLWDDWFSLNHASTQSPIGLQQEDRLTREKHDSWIHSLGKWKASSQRKRNCCKLGK